MSSRRKLPLREQVFIASLTYHGFRFSKKREGLKRNRGYIIPSTKQEDASLVDFWIKLPREIALIPLQVTQRGTAIFRDRQRGVPTERCVDFERASEQRIRMKREACQRSGIAFALIRDHTGTQISRSLAWGDCKALRYAISSRTTTTNIRVSSG